ncbi:MAG: CPBP family glutamic-type intramembrane protease [Eubacteriales bacterium]|nr:CPBP family glutamic-type intramembrane protease [Eubacteriales bacterium]
MNITQLCWGIAAAALVCFWQAGPERLLQKLHAQRHSLWLRAAATAVISIWLRPIYLWNLPGSAAAIPLFFILLMAFGLGSACFTAPADAANQRWRFALWEPLLDEWTFRGLLLPLLGGCGVLGNLFSMAGLLSVTPAVFVVACAYTALTMQQQRWRNQSVQTMLFGLLGGLGLGSLAVVTGSVWPGALLHIAFRAAMLARRNRGDKHK